MEAPRDAWIVSTLTIWEHLLEELKEPRPKPKRFVSHDAAKYAKL